MIDTKELRLGNLISYGNDEYAHMVKVDGFYGDGLETSNSLDTFHGSVESFFPIPLTKGWVESLGFYFDVEDENGVYRRQVGNNMDFMVDVFTGEAGFSLGWRNDFCHVWKEVKYVHEVQNIIYFLSKEELEVK